MTKSREKQKSYWECKNMNESERIYPFITALLVTYNEENYIEKSLLSLINQTYPSEKYEIVIIDGMSTDGTLDKINSIAKRYETHEIRIPTTCKNFLFIS